MPPASVAVVTIAALLLQLVPDPPGPASVERSFTTTEVGTTPVKVRIVRSRLTPRFTNPFGVTKQEQNAINCSSGENA